MSMTSRYLRHPEIRFPVSGSKDVVVEVSIVEDSRTSWKIHSMVRNCREVVSLIETVTPELEAYNLILNSPELMRLLALVKQIDMQADRERSSFMSNRKGVFDISSTVRGNLLFP